ncbi:MAG: urease accessory UreF family protein, partial [Pseudomonadota bacterium]|nr:urease accessory UreF family protein [Pseudomonadota bacterium]
PMTMATRMTTPLTEAPVTGPADNTLANPGLWQLISPGLPIGAFAYSQGLETATETGWVRDAQGVESWLQGVLAHGLSRLDVPVLVRLRMAWDRGDDAEIRDWTRFLLASRETAELRAEERHLGVALARLLAGLGVGEADDWQGDTPVTMATMFALATSRWGIPTPSTTLGYAWSWLENQTMAAVKLVPLGQTDGQRILRRIGAALPALVRDGAALPDEAIGASLPGLQYASMCHETQRTRLFRS